MSQAGRRVVAELPHGVALRLQGPVESWQRAVASTLAEQGLPPPSWLGPPADGADLGPWIDERAPDLSGRLREAGIGLVVDLGFGPPRLDPGVTVWQFRFGPEARPGPPGGAELVRGERSVLARLVELEGPGEGRVLVEGRIKAVPHSLAATRARVLDVIARWPARALAWRRAGLEGPEVERQLRLDPTPPPEPRARRFREASGAVRRLFDCTIEEAWRLGVLDADPAALLEGSRPSIRWLPVRSEGWLADPVGVRGQVVLAEAFDPATHRGHLVRTGLEAGAPVVPVLRAAHHLSWPFLVEEGGEIFLLPEASATGRIQLWRAAPFPDRFEPDAVLVEGFAGVDPTVLRHGGQWYLFAGDRADQDEGRLHLFVAEALRGPWRRHPMSPVVDDLGSARPAGPIFEQEGRLYRPAQDCTRTYGGAVVINRIEALTPGLYREVPIARLDPDPTGPCPDGLHTLTVSEAGILVDGKRERRSLRAFLANLRALLAERRAARPSAQATGAAGARSER
ncbi:MAG: hypothetical protein KatS3mg117_3013 [Geminicoccaceae bacterium]|nr:MAG: hypothetical protein KatS3mg117_3013 [Geminicoccaceae bacterium]